MVAPIVIIMFGALCRLLPDDRPLLSNFAPFCGARAGDLSPLLLIYNRRVDVVEMDKSLLIELPRNLPAQSP